MGKYSLVFYDDKKNLKHAIKMKEYNKKTSSFEYKDKVDLATIDKNTTYFDNYEAMISYLVKNEKIDFVPQEAFIEYNYKGLKRLEIVYKDNKILADLCHKSNSYVPINDNKFVVYVDSFLKKMNNGRFYRFIMEKGYLTTYLEEKVQELIYNGEVDQNFTIKLITEALSSYKTIRGIILGSMEYDRLGYNPIDKKKYKNDSISTSMTIEDTVLDLYYHGGMDDVYSAFDNEQLEQLDDSVKKILKIQ